MLSVFDVIDGYGKRPDDEITWIGVGAEDCLTGKFNNPDQYTSDRAKRCYRLGYRKMAKLMKEELDAKD